MHDVVYLSLMTIRQNEETCYEKGIIINERTREIRDY